MPGDPIHLQFTQDDRDMIRDTNRDVKQILGSLEGSHGLEARVEKLEMWQTRVMAICCFVGFVSGLVAKVFLK